ncbi:hypothetical protein C8C96_1839 [Acidovorax sp. 100]|uniref:hypothetical protein n=1 Tax=Acidovorax sp. 100 TaxID=2135635 RepID=UPI000EFA0C63|nr:hypothetical protein [Acidovorax sp. 100]RMA60816.1 hypothetical protein C8C96_1839 [Acidovorax sp. 100]
MPTDKYLLAAFITALIGFITAAMSVVRLVNDKESKTTDYRQAWTDSLRTSFATLLAKIELLTSTQVRYTETANLLHKLDQLGTDKEKDAKDYNIKVHTELTGSIARLTEELHTAYALTRLHFKPNDLSFARVEHKLDHISELLERLSKTDAPDGRAARQQLVGAIRVAISELTGFARDILKTEWEAVKRGEKAYQTTKRWSLIAGGITLVILLLFGGVALWSAGASRAEQAPPVPHTTFGSAPTIS